MQCLKPKMIPNVKTGKIMPVRCLKCIPCRDFKAGSWSIRLKEQDKLTNDNKFITLTLNDDNLTYAINEPTLCKRDLQLFFKRFRKKYPNDKFKYYAVGEYGENTKRPHYHMIMFRNKISENDSFEFRLLGVWNKGFTYVGNVTPASIRYVAGYLDKGIYGETISEKIQREFNLMSKGIGSNYIENTKTYHNENEKFEYHIGGGKFLPLPRYYAERIFDEQKRKVHSEKWQNVYESIPQKQKDYKREATESRVNALQKLKFKRK